MFLVYWYYTMAADYTTGDPAQDYGGGCGLGGYVASLVSFLWLIDPMKDWRYKGENVAPATYPLWKRIYYAMGLLCNQRRIGWTGEVSYGCCSHSALIWLIILCRIESQHTASICR